MEKAPIRQEKDAQPSQESLIPEHNESFDEWNQRVDRLFREWREGRE